MTACRPKQPELCGRSKEECITCWEQSFASHERSKYISDKNGDVKLSKIRKSDKGEFWFKCDKCIHPPFKKKLKSIMNNKNICQYCVKPSKILCKDNDCVPCLDRSFASVKLDDDKWSYKNGKIEPRNLFKCSQKPKFWFCCNACGHHYKCSLSNKTNGRGCPYCKGSLLCEDDECVDGECSICYDKSCASVPMSFSWSTKNKKTPREVRKNTHDKYIFECVKCAHEYKTDPHSIGDSSNGCPYCHSFKLCKNQCDKCYNNRFSSHIPENLLWDQESNKLSPDEVTRASNKDYSLICSICDHSFMIKPSKISRGDRCPYCNNNKLCLPEENCAQCLNKSFASHEKCRYWDFQKNKDNPKSIFKNCNKKYWFKCEESHSFEASLNHISSKERPTWCPTCKNKTEKKLHKWLVENFSRVKYQSNFEWCKNTKTDRYLPFDFLLDDMKIIIELDGDQHFRTCGNWKSHHDTRKIDVYKMYQALNNGYTVIRILQMDVLLDKNDWELTLKNAIYLYDEPEIVIISDGDYYESHLSDLQDLKLNFNLDSNDDDSNYDVINENYITEEIPTVASSIIKYPSHPDIIVESDLKPSIKTTVKLTRKNS